MMTAVLAVSVVLEFKSFRDFLEFAVFVVVASAVAGWLANRLLGVRRAWTRTFLLGFVGCVGGVGFAVAALHEVDAGALLYLITSGSFAVVVAMLAGILADVVRRPDRRRPDPRQLGRIGSLPRPITNVRRRLEPVSRFREVMGIARRNGLFGLAEQWRGGRADEAEVGRVLRLTLEQAGGMFVKLGQVASTRADLLPAPVVHELSNLRSNVPPEPAEAIRAVLEKELQRPVEEVFATFEWEPLASASIGQTHRATLHSGEAVIVKVQRPDIRDVVHRDGEAMLSVARFVDRRTQLGLQFDVVGLAKEFLDGLHDELDFRIEGRNGAAVAEHVKSGTQVIIPRVYESFTTTRLLVQEEIVGTTVADGAAVKATGQAPVDLARHLLRSMMEQMFQEGVFHADPHPGNVFVCPDGRLALLDFGAVGVLAPKTLTSLRMMQVAAVLNDPAMLRRAVVDITGAQAGVDVVSLEADLGRFLTSDLAASGGFDAELFRRMVGLLRAHKLDVPSGLTLLTRALVTLEGTLTTIDPGFTLASEADVIAREWAHELMVPENFDDQLRTELIRALPTLRTLPDQFEQLSMLVRSGGFTTNVRLFGHPADAAEARRHAGRFMLAIAGTAGLLASALALVAAALAPETQRFHDALLSLGFVGFFVASIVMMRVVAAVFRDGGV